MLSCITKLALLHKSVVSARKVKEEIIRHLFWLLENTDVSPRSYPVTNKSYGRGKTFRKYWSHNSFFTETERSNLNINKCPK